MAARSLSADLKRLHMTSTELSAVAGVALSLACSYVPGLSTWFNDRSPTAKRLIMAMLLLLVAVGAFVLSCINVDVADAVRVVECTQRGAWDLVAAYIAALVANQATYQISPQLRRDY